MDDKTLAAICTPIRDLRDEVWCRVYAAEFTRHLADGHTYQGAATRAGHQADRAIDCMPIPAHRKPEGT